MIWNAAKRFVLFWYGFLVGDDWVIAAGVVLALAATYGLLLETDAPVWWLLPLIAVAIVAISVWRGNRGADRAR